MQNKTVNYEIELKSSDLKVIEEKIMTLKTGNYKTGRKIKTQFGEFWLRDDFKLLFQEKNDFF